MQAFHGTVVFAYVVRPIGNVRDIQCFASVFGGTCWLFSAIPNYFRERLECTSMLILPQRRAGWEIKKNQNVGKTLTMRAEGSYKTGK